MIPLEKDCPSIASSLHQQQDLVVQHTKPPWMMSRKPEEKHTRCSLDGTKTKLLVPGSKPQIHEGFLESTR